MRQSGLIWQVFREIPLLVEEPRRDDAAKQHSAHEGPESAQGSGVARIINTPPEYWMANDAVGSGRNDWQPICGGGSSFFVWISGWGVIQAEDLNRSEEILTGAIPSAKDGRIVVETTRRGGRGGHLWDIVKKALETPEEQKLGCLRFVPFIAMAQDPPQRDCHGGRM
jgi:hypothetical protein